MVFSELTQYMLAGATIALIALTRLVLHRREIRAACPRNVRTRRRLHPREPL